MKVALLNTNRMQPPIAPIGLDYVAEALIAAGHEVALLDLCWEADPEGAIDRFFEASEYGLVGLTLRNTDDCVYTSRQSFIPPFAEYAKRIRKLSKAPIVLGGAGFSTMPEKVLGPSGADCGVWGDGEFVLPEMARRLEKGGAIFGLPNLVLPGEGGWSRNPPLAAKLEDLPPMRRRQVDNVRYFRAGGQIGFETKRGCPGLCIYCADPVAKGKRVRLRPPAAVADEIEALLEQGIDHLHTCDGEFNIPEDHGLQVCREMVRRGLGDRVRWYAYCAPAPFSQELAEAMAAAGCAGIDFGADNGSDRMLGRLGRGFKAEDIILATKRAKEAGIKVMLDLLLGAPGESRESVAETVKLVKRADPHRAGVSLGVRVYPGTPLAAEMERSRDREGLTGGDDPAKPLFFLEPEIAQDVYGWLHEWTDDDPRFLFYDPDRPRQNYNYNDNQRLVDAIERGYRGAYWDILRRISELPDWNS
jgi:radical SAM superfamily enzyme YgiQ (UPF0313 family)